MLTEEEVVQAFNNVVDIHNNIVHNMDDGSKALAEGVHFGVNHDLLVQIVNTICSEHFEVTPDVLEKAVPNIIYAVRQGVLVGIELGKLVALVSRTPSHDDTA